MYLLPSPPILPLFLFIYFILLTNTLDEPVRNSQLTNLQSNNLVSYLPFVLPTSLPGTPSMEGIKLGAYSPSRPNGPCEGILYVPLPYPIRYKTSTV